MRSDIGPDLTNLAPERSEEGSMNEPMLTRLLVRIAWERFDERGSIVAGYFDLEHPARFTGEFIGDVKTVRLKNSRRRIRIAFASKWNDFRRSYFLRLYFYDRDRKLFRPIAEVELDEGAVTEGLAVVEPSLDDFLDRACRQLQRWITPQD